MGVAEVRHDQEKTRLFSRSLVQIMAPSKKRKRDEGEDGRISFKLSALPENQLGPVLGELSQPSSRYRTWWLKIRNLSPVGFPSVQPSANTPFQCYRLEPTEDDPVSKEFAAQSTLVVAETDDVEFSSNSGRVTDADCTYAQLKLIPSPDTRALTFRFPDSYLVAVHDKRTGKTFFRPAPLHILTRQVKRLKSIQPTPVTTTQRIEARNALGATFGTKKAQAAIRAHERNKIDIDAMKAVTGKLQSTIEGNTANLPTQGQFQLTLKSFSPNLLSEQAKATADDSRLIPPFNADAERPDDVYPIANIITDAEWNSISISAMLKAETDRDRTALLPYNRSAWIKQKVREAFGGRKPNKTNLYLPRSFASYAPGINLLYSHRKLLFAISAIFTFYNARRNVSDKAKLQERLSRIPATLVDGLLSRFTDSARGSTKYVVSLVTRARTY